MLKVWNACLIVATFSLALLGTFLVRSGVLQSIHAFGDSTVGPYILGLIAVVLIGSTALIVSPARRPALARSGSTRWPRARRSSWSTTCCWSRSAAVIFWGTFFPLISELFTGEQGLAGGALVRPLHDAAGDPAGALHRDRAAARLAPGQLGLGEAGLPGAGRWSRPRWRLALALFTDAAHEPWALALFAFAAFALAGLGAGVLARRGGAPLARAAARCRRRWSAIVVAQPPPLRRLRRPRRRRRAADRDRRLLELPDQPRRHAEAGRERRRRRSHRHLRAADRQRRATRRSPSAPCSTSSRTASSFVAAARAGATSARPAPRRATIASFFEGEATSEVGLKPGLGSDLWTAVQPDIGGVQRQVRAADDGFRACVSGGPGTPPQCRAVAQLMRRPPANPRLRPTALAQIDEPAVGDRRADRQELSGRRRGRHLPRHRRPARHLDVDRRPDRPCRRADRALAGAPQPAASWSPTPSWRR